MQAAPLDPMIGQVLDDRWALTSLLGRGAMGTVYRAIDRRGGGDAAVKVFRPADVRNEEQRDRQVRRFRREALAMQRLTCPYVVEHVAFGEERQALYLVMELVDGESLERVIGREGALPPRRVASIGAQIAEALEEAHEAGVVHRDLKPANVFVGTGDIVKVGDFGIARVTSEDDCELSQITRTGHTIGSPHYMSPEQASAEEVDHKSDLYALGVVLFECLMADKPFRGANFVDIAVLHATMPAPPLKLAAVDAATEERWQALLARLLEKDPTHRPQSAAAVAEALRTLARSSRTNTPATRDLDGVLSVGDGRVEDLLTRPVTRPPRRKKGRRWPVVVAVAVVAALWAGVLVFTMVSV